jgi:hypothetical protein
MKKVFLVGLILCFCLSIPAVEKVSRLGQHPFYKDKDIQPGDLKVIAVDKAGDVKMGFEEAGNGELVFAFLEQIQQADVQSTELKPGDTMEWMLFKEGKKVKVKKDVVYDGKKPVPAYTFIIFREGKTYEFIVPKICGNISLKNTREIPAPVCTLNVTPNEVEAGKPVTIDMCASQNVMKSVVEVKDAAGVVVKTLELTAENCSAEVVLDKAGNYTVMGVGMGQYDMKSNPCEVALKINEVVPIVPVTTVKTKTRAGGKFSTQKPLSFLVEGGPGLLKGTYTGMFWARVGVQYNIVLDILDFVLSVGGGIPVKGDPWKSFLMGNALLNLHAGPAYLGAGMGFSTNVRDGVGYKGGIDLVGEIGINLFKAKSSIGSLFGELRAPVITADRTFEHNHKLLLGFRYIF